SWSTRGGSCQPRNTASRRGSIGVEADNLLRVGLVVGGLGGGHWRQSGADEWETPGGYRVPDVLDCRIIVGGNTPQQIVSLDIDRVGVTNIGVVSQPKRRVMPSYVPWMNAPRLSVN